MEDVNSVHSDDALASEGETMIRNYEEVADTAIGNSGVKQVEMDERLQEDLGVVDMDEGTVVEGKT
jgi:hypothetical protein